MNNTVKSSILSLLMVYCLTGCVSFSFGKQKSFDFTVVYYMNGTCEVKMPNRNGVFIAKGKFYSDDGGLRHDSSLIPGKKSFSIVCDMDKEISDERNRIRNARTTITLALEPKIDGIQFTDENHIKLNHVVEDPWIGPLNEPDRYRFIQRENDILIDTRAAINEKSSFYLDEYFRTIDGLPGNYDTDFSFKFSWGSAYGRQLPGITVDIRGAIFSSKHVIITINGSKKAAESGVYASVTGEKGTITSNWSK